MSAAQDYTGPWLSNEAATRLPNVRREFDRNRDPMIARQMADLNQTEAERRRGQVGKGEKSGRGSGMVQGDASSRHHRPPPDMRRSPDRKAFEGRWLSEQRSAVMARAKAPEKQAAVQLDHTHQPSR